MPNAVEPRIRQALIDMGLSERLIDECQSIVEHWLVEKRRQAKGGVNRG